MFPKLVARAAKGKVNSAEKMENVWHPGTPYRPVGCFSDSEAIPNPTPRYPTKIVLPWRPVGSRAGDNPKKV